MFKAFISGFLIAVGLCCILYFVTGQRDYQKFNGIADGLSNEHGKVEHTLNNIGLRLSGLDTISTSIAERSERITSNSDELSGRIEIVREGLGTVNNTIDRLGKRNIDITRIIGNNRDLDYRFREIIKDLQNP